jgi:uncharacterized circularly permuted ATP-grasp superfamily protein
LLGVPGLVDAYRRATRCRWPTRPGNGVADDKVMYAYVPDMIRYYEGEEPKIIPNVPTYLCWRDTTVSTCCRNLETLVVKGPPTRPAATACSCGPHSTGGRARGVQPPR